MNDDPGVQLPEILVGIQTCYLRCGRSLSPFRNKRCANGSSAQADDEQPGIAKEVSSRDVRVQVLEHIFDLRRNSGELAVHATTSFFAGSSFPATALEARLI